jgi:hypothetical protein
MEIFALVLWLLLGGLAMVLGPAGLTNLTSAPPPAPARTPAAAERESQFAT